MVEHQVAQDVGAHHVVCGVEIEGFELWGVVVEVVGEEAEHAVVGHGFVAVVRVESRPGGGAGEFGRGLVVGGVFAGLPDYLGEVGVEVGGVICVCVCRGDGAFESGGWKSISVLVTCSEYYHDQEDSACPDNGCPFFLHTGLM